MSVGDLIRLLCLSSTEEMIMEMNRWVIAVIVITILVVPAGIYFSSQPPPAQPVPTF